MTRLAIAAALSILLLCGCGIGSQYWPDEQELAAFEAAGPIQAELDLDQMLSGVPKAGPYRVVPGDLLEIRGAGGFLLAEPRGTLGPSTSDIIQVRVQDDGTVSLPLVGALQVVSPGEPGEMLTELENTVADSLFPKFLAQRPAIVVRVLEPARVKVAVHGAVENPGVVQLASDQLSLFGALSEAGGIIKASNLKTGARVIKIRRPGDGLVDALSLPVKGLNVPYADVVLQGGETVEVERWDPELFTVIGLVVKPGAYEYPPGQKYNLMQALAIAGGVDLIADPPYATVFRADENGQIVAATFGISGNDLIKASGLAIRPGDVIAVEHTIGSWSRSFIATVFRAQLTFYLDPTRN